MIIYKWNKTGFYEAIKDFLHPSYDCNFKGEYLIKEIYWVPDGSNAIFRKPTPLEMLNIRKKYNKGD